VSDIARAIEAMVAAMMQQNTAMMHGFVNVYKHCMYLT